MSEEQYYIKLFAAVIRVIGVIYCSVKAGNLNRNQWGWGAFGLFLPVPAIIWIQFLKPKSALTHSDLQVRPNEQILKEESHVSAPKSVIGTEVNQDYGHENLDRNIGQEVEHQSFSFLWLIIGFISCALMTVIVISFYPNLFSNSQAPLDSGSVTTLTESPEPSRSTLDNYIGTSALIINRKGDTISLATEFSEYQEQQGFAASNWYEFVDFDNDGKSELITKSFSGGAHCCTEFEVFNQIDAGLFKSIFLFDNAAYDGFSRDENRIYLNMYEQIGYFYSCYACYLQVELPNGYLSPALNLEYVNNTVVPVTGGDWEISEIMENLTFLKDRSVPNLSAEFPRFDDGTRKAFAAHMIKYHYAGGFSLSKTESVFRDYYIHPDVDNVWSEIESILIRYKY